MALGLTGSAARAMQADWLEHLNPAASVSVTSYGVSLSEAHEYLDGVGLSAGTVPDVEVNSHGSDAFHGVMDARSGWAATRLELNGKFASRVSIEAFGRAMTVTSVITPDGLLRTDDQGGTRVETYRKFPSAKCSRRLDCDDHPKFDTARDEHGTITEFVRDRNGLPSAVLFAETLLLRYDFTPPLPEPPWWEFSRGRWRLPASWELIDLRTSEIVIDSSEFADVALQRPWLSVRTDFGELLRFEGGEAFVVASDSRGASYALLPLERTSEVWRTLGARGDRAPGYGFSVHYTDEFIRVRIPDWKSMQIRSIVVEAPRSRKSLAPVSFVHPEAEKLTDVLRSGVRLRVTGPLDYWLHSEFDKEKLPVVLRPLAHKGLEFEGGVIREAAASGGEPQFDFGPAEGCKEQARGLVCAGGRSEVVGEVHEEGHSHW